MSFPYLKPCASESMTACFTSGCVGIFLGRQSMCIPDRSIDLQNYMWVWGTDITMCAFSTLAVGVLHKIKEARKGERQEEAVNCLLLKVSTWMLLKMAQQTQ